LEGPAQRSTNFFSITTHSLFDCSHHRGSERTHQPTRAEAPKNGNGQHRWSRCTNRRKEREGGRKIYYGRTQKRKNSFVRARGCAPPHRGCPHSLAVPSAK